MPRLPRANKQTGQIDQSDYAKYTDDLWRSYDAFYRVARVRWERTINFLRGNHWRVLEDYDIDALPDWKRYPVIGTTLGIYNDLLGQWLQSQVRFSAGPASEDYEDIYRAEQAELLLRFLWDHTGADLHKIELGAWLLTCGCGTLTTYWNTDTGNLLPLAIPEMQTDEQGQQVPTGKLIPVNPETLTPDKTMDQPVLVDAGDIALQTFGPDMARWGQYPAEGVMLGQYMTFDEAADRYGEDVANKMQFSNRDAALDLTWLGFPRLRPSEDQRALVVRHYLPRSYRRPDGLWWEASNGKLLVDPSGLPGKRVPAVPFRFSPVVGHHALGLSPLYEVSYSNKSKDAIRARQEEWMERVVPKVLLKNGGGVVAGDMTDEPFQEIEGVTPGAEPDVLQYPAFPEQFVRMDQDADNDALFAAGYKFQRRPQPQAGTPRRVIRQPQALAEGSEVKLPLLVTKPAWEETARILLSFVGDFYTDARVVPIGGPDRTYQWLAFKGTDFKNFSASIHVDEVPLYPWSRQALRESVVALMQTPAGQVFFQNPEGQLDREKLQRAAEAVGIDVALSTLDPDTTEARNEIGMLQSGQRIEYQDYQNSETHLIEKLKVVKSMAFKGWPQPAQQALLMNVKQHRQALQQQQEIEDQKLLKQELALRTIRANVDAQGDTRKVLGEMLVDVVRELLMPKSEREPKE